MNPIISAIVIALCLSTSTATSPCNPAVCPNWGITNHYRDLHCNAIYSPTDSCCPIAYDCKTFDEFNENKDKCVVSSVVGFDKYNVGATIPDNAEETECLTGCFCQNDTTGAPPHVQCANIECPEFFHNNLKENCRYEYKLNKCCAVGQICNEETNKKSCEFHDKVYKHGERVSNTDNCNKCVCNDGSMECKPLNCNTLIKHGRKLSTENVGIRYPGVTACCPIGFVEYTPDYIVDPLSKQKPSQYQCKFGDLTLNVGEEVKRKEDKCTECQCMVPPFLTCLTKQCT